MATTVSFPTISASVLASYYTAKLPVSAPQTAALTAAASGTSAAASGGTPPWENLNPPAQQAQTAAVLATTNFVDLGNATLTPGSSTDAKLAQDNERLFALYNGLNALSQLAALSQSSTATAGQMAGYNTRFQAGLAQVKSYLASTTFNNFTLQSGAPSASATSTVSVPFATFGYQGGTVVSDANLANPLSKLSASQSFDVTVTKGGVATDVPIDLSQVQGGLTLDNVVSYVNQQLSAAGFATRFQRVMTQGSIDDPTTASYGISVNAAPSEKVSLSSAAAVPSIYVAGTSGSAIGATTTTGSTTTTSAPDQQGRLLKLDVSGAAPQSVFNATANPDTGNTTAQSTVVDAQGNVYVVGNATGNFGNQLNQASQDVVLSKYDSAGNLQWTKLLGSTGTASGYSLAVDPTGGVVVAGSTTADLTTAAIANGNADSFVTKFAADGSQTWTTQIQTLNANQANAVSVDASGNVYIGGKVSGVIGAGQTSQGGSDAYLAKITSAGKLSYEQQFGTSGSDSVAATAVTADGSLIVASVQNGHAILSKYAGGDATTAPVWQMDAGDLKGGSIGGLAISGSQIYISGTTSNTALNAPVAAASSGGSDAFVFSATDNGMDASANQVSYVGTAATDSGGALTVAADGTVYLTGTTTGTFAGETRNVAGVNNMFVSALAPDGSIAWTHQYGGASGQSTGNGIAIDTQGSSVLDALGLPRGAVAVNQSVDLTAQSTLRAGDSFSVDIQGPSQGIGARKFTVTVDKGETLSSLVNKINAEMLNAGKASVTYANGGEALQIKLNSGFTASLVPGPGDFDALSRLGIPAGTLTNGASTTSSSAGSSSSTAQVFGLGLTGNLDISTASGAGAAKATLLNVLSSIRNAYRTLNTPASASGSAASSAPSGPVPAYLQAQLANYNAALSLMGGSTS
ncbi:MAG: beta strand repeat-containing protein [Rhizomicrobium sp.]